MPRSRGSEMPQQRQSPRVPLHLKTTSSAESNGVHRPVRDRSPKLEDHRRSPRSPLPEVGVCNQKKRGTRVTDLETRLGHAKEELKKLKEQLTSAENARRDAQQELEETKKLIPTVPIQQSVEEREGEVLDPEIHTDSPAKDGEPVEELPAMESPAQESSLETNVIAEYDVVQAVVEPTVEQTEKEDDITELSGEKEKGGEVKTEEQSKEAVNEEVAEVVVVADPEQVEVLGLEDTLEKEKELESYLAENATLKRQLEEANAEATAARAKEEEMGLKLGSLQEELEQSRAKAAELAEQLEAMEEAKAALEKEMKRLSIQTDQWRKAADAAAAIISADGGMGLEANGSRGRRVSERCVSMDKHIGGGGIGYEMPAVGNGLLGSPMMTWELEDGLGNGKRKGAGIRMFGELWKKKGQQK